MVNTTDHIAQFMDHQAKSRRKWLTKNWYYYQDLYARLRYIIPSHQKVLEIGCGTGDLLYQLQPSVGVGIDLSAKMIAQAKKKYRHYQFIQQDAHRLRLRKKFDYVVMADTVGYLVDVQQVFTKLHQVTHPDSRIVITLSNPWWNAVLSLAERFRLKMPSLKQNWLTTADITNLLAITGYEVVVSGRQCLLPIHIPTLSHWVNTYLAYIPGLRQLGLTQYLVARPKPNPELLGNQLNGVSIIIPARNEAGNIAAAIRRIPQFAPNLELIFVEGHSRDNTLTKIKQIAKRSKPHRLIRYAVQPGVGKGDAVRQGFAMAQYPVLMILDADLTTPPESLPAFYQALTAGVGDFINGTRLIYPREKQAMRFLNMIGNTFFSWAFSWILDQRITDTLCGTKVLTKKLWHKIEQNRAFFGEFDPFGDFDLLFGAAKLQAKIVEVPVRYRAREYGETNISRFRHGWLLLQMVWFALPKIKFISAKP